MENKAKDMCPRCKYCLGMTPQGMYSCGKANDGSELNIGIDVVLNCANFEWKDGKVEGKASDICPKCKNCKGVTRESNGVHVWLTEVECEDPYDGMVKTLDADSDIRCSMFEVKEDKLMQYYREKSKNYEQILIDISRFVPVDVTDFKDLPMIIEQMRKAGDKYDAVSESYDALSDQKYELQKANEKLEDKVHKLERGLHNEKERARRLDTELLTPLARVLYPREAKICKPYSEIIEDIKRLVDKSEILEQHYDNIHYTLYKDWSDDSISCPSDIPSEVEMIEDLKYWRERCHGAETDVTTLNSKVEILKNKNNKLIQTISDQEITIKALLLTIKEMCKEENENA